MRKFLIERQYHLANLIEVARSSTDQQAVGVRFRLHDDFPLDQLKGADQVVLIGQQFDLRRQEAVDGRRDVGCRSVLQSDDRCLSLPDIAVVEPENQGLDNLQGFGSSHSDNAVSTCVDGEFQWHHAAGFFGSSQLHANLSVASGSFVAEQFVQQRSRRSRVGVFQTEVFNRSDAGSRPIEPGDQSQHQFHALTRRCNDDSVRSCVCCQTNVGQDSGSHFADLFSFADQVFQHRRTNFTQCLAGVSTEAQKCLTELSLSQLWRIQHALHDLIDCGGQFFGDGVSQFDDLNFADCSGFLSIQLADQRDHFLQVGLGTYRDDAVGTGVGRKSWSILQAEPFLPGLFDDVGDRRRDAVFQFDDDKRGVSRDRLIQFVDQFFDRLAVVFRAENQHRIWPTDRDDANLRSLCLSPATSLVQLVVNLRQQFGQRDAVDIFEQSYMNIRRGTGTKQFDLSNNFHDGIHVGCVSFKDQHAEFVHRFHVDVASDAADQVRQVVAARHRRSSRVGRRCAAVVLSDQAIDRWSQIGGDVSRTLLRGHQTGRFTVRRGAYVQTFQQSHDASHLVSGAFDEHLVGFDVCRHGENDRPGLI